MLERVNQGMRSSTGWMNSTSSQTLIERISKLARWMIIPALVGLGIYAAIRRYSYAAPLTPKPGLVVKPYPETGTTAIAFARAELQRQTSTQPHKFYAAQAEEKTYQPINPEIAQLQALYNMRYEIIETNLLNSTEQLDPWEDQRFLQQVDEAMSIAYAISCLTLEDLANFQQALKQQGVDRTLAKCLTEQDSYQYRTFYECTWLYHLARAQFRPFFNEVMKERQLDLYGHISSKWAELFYKPALLQGKWRELYNDFCDRVRMYVKEEELEKADSRHVKWSKKDERKAGRGYTFVGCPSTLPT